MESKSAEDRQNMIESHSSLGRMLEEEMGRVEHSIDICCSNSVGLVGNSFVNIEYSHSEF